MLTQHSKRAELSKLAAALNVPPENLNPLEALDASEIRHLRQQYQATVHKRFSSVCKRIAQACRVVPAPVAARLAENFFGPQLTAHVAVHLPAKSVLKICQRFPKQFLADVVHYIDAQRGAEMLNHLPIDLLTKMFNASIENGDYAVLAEVLESTHNQLAAQVVAGTENPIALLEIANLVSPPERLVELVNNFDDNIIATIANAVAEADSHDLALSLLTKFNASQQQQVANAVQKASPAAADALINAAKATPLHAALAPFIDSAPTPVRKRSA